MIGWVSLNCKKNVKTSFFLNHFTSSYLFLMTDTVTHLSTTPPSCLHSHSLLFILHILTGFLCSFSSSGDPPSFLSVMSLFSFAPCIVVKWAHKQGKHWQTELFQGAPLGEVCCNEPSIYTYTCKDTHKHSCFLTVFSLTLHPVHTEVAPFCWCEDPAPAGGRARGYRGHALADGGAGRLSQPWQQLDRKSEQPGDSGRSWGLNVPMEV